MNRKGQLIVFSGPSGVGKNTVLAELIKKVPNILFSISATTRKIRDGETDGVNYYFKTREQFEQMIKNDELLEFAEYNGNYYGTPKAKLFDWVNEGNVAILEIEVQGAAKVKKSCPEAVFIFLAPPSMDEIKKRLRGRNTETEESINQRYAVACREISHADEYDYIVINDEVEKAAESLKQIINAEYSRVIRNESTIKKLKKEIGE